MLSSRLKASFCNACLRSVMRFWAMKKANADNGNENHLDYVWHCGIMLQIKYGEDGAG